MELEAQDMDVSEDTDPLQLRPLKDTMRNKAAANSGTRESLEIKLADACNGELESLNPQA